MSRKMNRKDNNKYNAKLVSEVTKPCAFCRRKVDDEVNFGKIYAIGDIQCHYFCVLLSCCLVQNGPDDTGLFGFTYTDILAELDRCKKHKCSYCNQYGANMGCCVGQCRKQFHLPCGREKKVVSLFYGSFKSFCRVHAPKQKIPEHLATNIRNRKKLSESMVCVICYEDVEGYPTSDTFMPPCCGKDAWFHRSCLQRMALSAGMHYLKCPLCNDKDTFYQAVLSQGYYVPDRDAAWELEQNAFAEIYERPVSCNAELCQCPLGRKHDAENGPWDIKLCLLCGSSGCHTNCTTDTYVCNVCKPVAPEDLDTLTESIERVILQEQEASRNVVRPIMPSRMSLRRTKGLASINRPSSSGVTPTNTITETSDVTTRSRQELNLKTPRKLTSPKKFEDHTKQSPSKLIQSLQEKLDEQAVEKIKRKIMKPQPLSRKRKIVNEALDNLLNNPLKDIKQKDPVKEWCSPKKYDISSVEETQPIINSTSTPKKTPTKSQKTDIQNDEKTDLHDDSSNSTFQLPPEFIADVHSDDDFVFEGFAKTKTLKTVEIKQDSSLEIFEKDQSVTVDLVKKEPSENFFKFSPLDKDSLDVENFKKEYLNEVSKAECKGSSTEIKKETNDDICQNDSDVKKGTKRKIDDEVFENRRRKKSKKSANKSDSNETKSNRAKRKKLSKKKNIKLTVSSNKKSKLKTELSIKNKDIKLKFQWRKQQILFQLLSKKENKKTRVKMPKTDSKLTQYVLQCQEKTNELVMKPEKGVTPLKRKKIKQEKSPDNLKQTSLHLFFNVKPRDDHNNQE